MYKDITVKYSSEFARYTDAVLVTGDVNAYRIVFETPWVLDGCNFKVTAKRADGKVVTDLGTTEETKAICVLASGVYSVVGDLTMQLTLESVDGTVLTACEITATVAEGNGEGEQAENLTPVLDKAIERITVLEAEMRASASNLTNGDGMSSIMLKTAAGAISEGAVAFGKNSIAGSKCFNITAFDETNKAYTLDSVEGLVVGDVFSLKLKNNYDNKGKITAVSGKVVTVDNYQPDETSDVKYFRVPLKPKCGTTDFGTNAYAEGENCIAAGDNSHASGKGTHANGRYAHTEGKNTEAAYAAHAEGQSTEASGDSSHAEGASSKARGAASHAEGKSTQATGHFSHAEGQYTTANGESSHAEGDRCSTKGYAAHAEGASTVASGINSHAEGFSTTASGLRAHSEGDLSKATNKCSHAEGFNTEASGELSHAEGNCTKAVGDDSHAEGASTIASGTNSHAEGNGTIAKGRDQHVEGKFNIEDASNKYLHIAGNGYNGKYRSNAYTLDWNGNAWYAGHVEASDIWLRSPGGKLFCLSVNDNGELLTTQINSDGSEVVEID